MEENQELSFDINPLHEKGEIKKLEANLLFQLNLAAH